MVGFCDLVGTGIAPVSKKVAAKANGKVAVRMAKSFQHQMAKQFHIFKWIFFVISTFAIMEEIASAVFEKCY